MARNQMSGAWKHQYFRQAVEILRGDLRTPPDYYSIVAAAVLGGTVLDHTRLEAAYPRVFAAVWEQIEMRRLTCSVCGKPLERGAPMPLRTDPKWDESKYTYRHHDRHLDTELRRVLVSNGSGTGVHKDAATTLSTKSQGAKRGRRS